jgi:REP-associated tyrosine transposase
LRTLTRFEIVRSCSLQPARHGAAGCWPQNLRDIWSRSPQENGWYVGDYIIMPDHVHLFARPGLEALSLKRWMATWKSLSARKIAETLLLRPPIWQPDYFDRYLRSRDSYSAKWIYIQQNAVRAGLVEHSDQWRYKGVINTLMFN